MYNFDDILVDAPTSPSLMELAAGEVNLYLESGIVVTFDSLEGKHCSIGSKGHELVIRCNFEVVWSGRDVDTAAKEVAKLKGG